MPNQTSNWDRLLDWIARTYIWVYCKFFQRPITEPYTRQCSRMEQRWPTFCWGFALVVFYTTAQLRGWYILITLAVYLFAVWFLPHIVRYRVAHTSDNVPYKSFNNRAVKWAAERIRKRGGNELT